MNRVVLLVAGTVLLAGPCVAAPSVAAPSPPGDTATPATQDADFMTGLRRAGVLAGRVVQCTPESGRDDVIGDGTELADDIADQFGLRAAYDFIGAMGYGAGKPFDKSGCAQAQAEWNDIKNKYVK